MAGWGSWPFYNGDGNDSQQQQYQDKGVFGSDIQEVTVTDIISEGPIEGLVPVSYTHLRAHET